MPCGSTAPEPMASFSVGRPNSITPPRPASTASLAAFFSESRVCWTTPGIVEISRGSVASSATNIGSTSWLGRTEVSATSRRSAGVRRSRRGRISGNPMRWPGYFELARRRVVGRRSDGLVTG